jgi:hypothetical protein
MNLVEQKLSALREKYRAETDPVEKELIRQEAENYKCCILVGPKDQQKRCGKPNRTLKSVVCEEHTEKRPIIGQNPRNLDEVIATLKARGQEKQQSLV